jgi:hypothetical protein
MVCFFALALWIFNPAAFAATAYHGQVTFNALPVPGVTVTATQGDKKEVAITDPQGSYVFQDIADGAWKFQVEMQGFEPQTQDVNVATGTPAPNFDLKLLSLSDITHGAAPVQAEKELPPPLPAANGNAAPPATAATTAPPASGSQTPPANTPSQPAKNAANNTPPPQAPPQQAADTNSGSSNDLQQSAATGLVVNGSVNNGAASVFSQAASFGNNRRGPGLFYNGNAGVNFDTSAWDARNFSPGILTGPKPSYNQLSFLGNVGGPIGTPHHYFANSQFVVNYQHGANDTASAVTGLVPTLLQRTGNFSQSVNALGQLVVVYNPATNQPYANDAVPISPQGQALLNQYPTPNVANVQGINYQTSGLTNQHLDSLQTRLSKFKNRNQFFGNFGYQRQVSENDANIFGYRDASNSQGIDAAISWQRIYRPGGLGYLTTNFKYEFNRLASSQNPFFANRVNVSGEAGIQGNDQSPQNWGPPDLTFTSIAGLSEPEYARNANDTQTFSYSSLWYRGKHSLQFGVDVARLQLNANTQQDGRGAFSFTGTATQHLDANGQPVAGTGSDLADFLIGVPDTAGIAFGNADKYLRGWRYDAFVNDDWRMKAGFTLDAGLRWEFATPLTESQNRLSNLDVSPTFGAAAPVTGTSPTGPITGQKYPNSLLQSDYSGFEPRLSIAWRPRSNSPLVIRAGYGIYDITSIYQVIATQMAQQPPFSKSFNLTNSAATPLALATAFNTSSSTTSIPTFGVDPNFRIGYAQVWDASLQQDLPGSLVLTATYMGHRGSHLMQEFMPNMYPVGSALACPACPSGFVYLTSNGFLNRESGKVQLRRRLRNGLTATLEYTYAKATDDASAFSGAAITSGGSSVSTVQSSGGGGLASIAQNWQSLRGELSRSPFDQRNLLTFTEQYTTGEGLHAGALMSGWRGTVFKDWTIQSSLTVGSGLPLTPIYQSTVTGIGVPWIIRPDATGVSVTAAPTGRNLNPAAFAAPTAGQFGDAQRDSITGPSQFSLNAGFSRTFRVNSRVDATWETQAANVLNRVTPSSWITTWNSAAFGATASWNGMRKLSTTIRVRF